MKTVLFAFLLFSTGCLAQKIKLKKALAFSQPLSTGTSSLADSSHNDKTNRYFAYLEVKANTAIEMEHAWVNGILCSINSTGIEENNIVIGQSLSNKKIIITRSTGYQLLFLEFSEETIQKKIPASFQNKKAGSVILELIYNKKSIYYLIPSISKLKTDITIN